MFAAALALSVSSARAGDTDDTVFLKSGARSRGIVLEEDPTTGVRLRLPDGTIRAFAPKDVSRVDYGGKKAPPAPQAAPPPPTPEPATVSDEDATGSLHVESERPATVSVDGGDYGATPVDVPQLPRGKHKVVIQYDEGGSDKRSVYVRPGAVTPIVFKPSDALRLFGPRKGSHFGLGAELGFWFVIGGSMLPGGRAYGRLNYAMSPSVDLRLDASIGAFAKASTSYGCGYPCQGTESAVAVPLVARFDAQFNLSPVYSMVVGLDMGANLLVVQDMQTRTINGTTAQTSSSDLTPLFHVGPHVSLLTFRFGEQRQFMVAAQEGVTLNVGSGLFVAVDQSFSFTYLFGLGSAPPAKHDVETQ